MIKRQESTIPHPDDLIMVSLGLDFQAKLNPEAVDPMPLEWTALEHTMSASEAVDYLETVVKAIQERRLYGFVAQQIAEDPVGAGEWIQKTAEEVLAEAKGKQEMDDE